MKFTTSRALIVSMMDESQLKQIHFLENNAKRCLANHEICEILRLPTIKERYALSDKDEAQAEYSYSIEMKVKDFVLQTEGEGLVNCINVEKTHLFDNIIFSHKDNVMWEHPGRKSSVLDRLKNNL